MNEAENVFKSFKSHTEQRKRKYVTSGLNEYQSVSAKLFRCTEFHITRKVLRKNGEVICHHILVLRKNITC